jgi:hypothetical protein
MTGRRLYDHFCDALAGQTSAWQRENGFVATVSDAGVKAWPFLTTTDRKVWSAMALAITPRGRKSR